MTENDKVIVLRGGAEVGKFLLDLALEGNKDWIPEFEDAFLKGHVIGYFKGKVVVLDTNHEAKKECGCID